jgi:aspartyl aminopeptidase
MALKPGSKVYFNNSGKSLILAVMGEKPLTEGCVIAGAHVDAPAWISSRYRCTSRTSWRISAPTITAA